MSMGWFNPLRKIRERGTVIVNLRTGTVFRGIVYQSVGDFVEIRQAEMLSDRDAKMEPHVMNGEVFVNKSDIDFIQVPHGGH